MKLEFGSILLALACVLAFFSAAGQDGNVNVTVRHAPYVVSTVSSKTERGNAPCKYCSATIRYDRKFKWDVYNHEWVETTKTVPEVCRKCRQNLKAQEKLDKEERVLDQKIEYLETKDRIKGKRRRLSRLRKASR